MDWIELLDEATGRFAALLEDGDLDTKVPTCPGWSLADLGDHLRRTHVWAAHAVSHRSPDGEPAPGSLGRDQLVPGYRAAAAHLLDVLVSAGPDAGAWTLGEPRTAGFWRRRQVHETTMHVYDALAAHSRDAEWHIAPELAWAGVDEVATMFYPRQVRLGRIDPLAGTLRLRADDVDAGPVDIGHGKPVAELTGAASYLLRALWKRAEVADPVARKLLETRITP